MSQSEEECLDIRVRLKGQVKDQFLDIKRNEGLTNNTEVLRLIINDYYKRNLASKGKAKHE
jgi:hypothetical protein